MAYEGTHPGEPDLIAWIGEDENGSGAIGIKQACCSVGIIPIVAVIGDEFKIGRADFIEQMQLQADDCGKTIRLVRYTAVKELIVVKPRGRG